MWWRRKAGQHGHQERGAEHRHDMLGADHESPRPAQPLARGHHEIAGAGIPRAHVIGITVSRVYAAPPRWCLCSAYAPLPARARTHRRRSMRWGVPLPASRSRQTRDRDQSSSQGDRRGVGHRVVHQDRERGEADDSRTSANAARTATTKPTASSARCGTPNRGCTAARAPKMAASRHRQRRSRHPQNQRQQRAQRGHPRHRRVRRVQAGDARDHIGQQGRLSEPAPWRRARSRRPPRPPCRSPVRGRTRLRWRGDRAGGSRTSSPGGDAGVARESEEQQGGSLQQPVDAVPRTQLQPPGSAFPDEMPMMTTQVRTAKDNRDDDAVQRRRLLPIPQ